MVVRIVYGTDYPYNWPVGIDFIVNAPFLSNPEKEAILGGNFDENCFALRRDVD